MKNDKKDAKLIRFCLIAGAGYIFNDTADTITLKSLIRQRESLVSDKLKAKIQQYDIIYKENCIKRKINPVYQELYVMFGKKIQGIEAELRKYRRDEQMLLESIPGIGPITSASFTPHLLSGFSDMDFILIYFEPSFIIDYFSCYQLRRFTCSKY